MLTASAAKVDPSNSTYKQRKNQDWQKNAFAMVKLIPEYNYASRFYSKMFSKLRIYPGLRGPNDEVEEITDGPPVEILEQIQDPGGGRSQLLRQYGRLMFIIGDAYLFGRHLGNDEKERWAFINPDELEVSEDKILWKPNLTGNGETFAKPSEAVAYRFWTPDPEKSGEAESPMRAILEIGEELDILTKAVRSTAVSRMLRGILKVPTELSFGAETPGLDADPEENPFLREMIEYITGVVENAGSAEAAIPQIAEGAAEFLKELSWMPTHNPATDYLERELRKEAIERSAMGLDLPPEVLKGFASANHWGARQILHDTWRSHGSVVAEQFCDDLCEAYLRPALREEGYPDWKSVVVAYDDSNVIVPPDRTDDADKAHDHGAVSNEGYRRMKGITEDYEPSDEERRVWLAIKLKNPAFLKGTKYEIEIPELGPGTPGPDPSQNGKPDAEEGPAEPGPAGTTRRESRALSVRAAAQFAILRCRQAAGSRICTLHTKKRLPIPELDEVSPKESIAALIGPARLSGMGIPGATHLVKNGTDGFVALCVEWGIEEVQGGALAQMIESYAARTLYEPRLPSLPAGLEAAIERANEVSPLSEKDIVEQNNEALAELSRMVPGGETIVSR